MTNQLDIEIKEKEKLLASKKKQKKALKKQFLQITSSNFYKLWQKINNFKRLNFTKEKIKEKDYSDNVSFDKKNIVNEKISIIIPTRNGGEDFKKNLKSILKQKNIPNHEIIIMDNNSQDDTAKFAKKMGCIVYNVPENEFHHSKTRLDGIKKSKGQYLILSVQDANAKNPYTYCNLINFTKEYNLSAASGMQDPKPEADSFARWQLFYHYSVLSPQKKSTIYNGKKLYNNFDNLNFILKRKIICIDDVIACYKREVFDKTSFSNDIEFAEDADIAVKIIKNKGNIGLATNSIVYHSHNVEPIYIFKRGLIDTISLKNIFNQKLNRIDNKKTSEKNTQNEITTIFMLMSKLITKKKYKNIEAVISDLVFNKIDENQIIESLRKIYPNLSTSKINLDETLCRSISHNSKSALKMYTNFCKRNNTDPDNNKLFSNILGGYLAEIILKSNDKNLYLKVKKSFNQRV